MFDYSYRYKIQDIDNKIYPIIRYKNMDIKWTLQGFYTKELYKLAQENLEVTKQTKYYNLSNIFVCKNKKDLEKIYLIFMEYYKTNKLPNVDIVTPAIKNFISNNKIWQDFE